MKNILLIIIIATLCPSAIFAGEHKVGLVLSGGGAKGIAHVGVIKALEENDIPIDCVSGTSMGAVVGSLYACGWSPDSMMNMITSDGFRHWSSGVVDRRLLTLVSSPVPSPSWLEFSFGGEKTDVLSQLMLKSVIDPTPMNIEFLRLYAPYTRACNGDFDRLFVPFRCVFSDVYHKRKVVCSKGSLGESVRGSMSFPLVYRSIMVDSILAFDGGIYDNFPVDVMHDEFDPDFIIGVSVSRPSGKPKLNDAYSEIEALVIQKNDYSLAPELGVKIQVPVTDFGVLSFDKAREIYDIGYKTGIAMVDSIKSRIAARRPSKEVQRRREQFEAAVPEVTFDSIATPDVSVKQRNYLLSVFESPRGKDAPLTLENVENSYYDVVSQDDVEQLLPEAQGNVLILKAKVKHPWRASAGGWLTTGVGSYIYGSLGLHTLDRNSIDASLSLWGGQSFWAADLRARLRLSADFPSYLSVEGFASRKKLYDDMPFFFSNDSIVSTIEHLNFARLAYERGIGRSDMLGVSLAYGSHSHVRVAKANVGYLYNTLDSRTFPISGRLVSVSLAGMRLDDHNSYAYEPQRRKVWRGVLSGVWNNYYSLTEKLTLGAYAGAGVSVGPRLSDRKTDLMVSHSFGPLECLDNSYIPALRGDDYVAFGLIPAWSLMSRIQLRGEAYAYSAFRDGSCWRAPFRRTEFLGRMSVVGTLPFATVSLSVAYISPLGSWNFGVALGWFVPAPKL